MLVVCWDIHLLGSPLISIVVIRMQDLASKLSKFFRGSYPRTLTAVEELPPPPNTQPGLWQAPHVVTEAVVPLNFSSVVALLEHDRKFVVVYEYKFIRIETVLCKILFESI